VFVESQKTFKEFNELIGQVSAIKSQIKDIGEKADKLEVKSATFMETKKFEKRMDEVEQLAKRMKDIADRAEKGLKQIDANFGEVKGELKGAFDERIERAETLSNAFAKVLQDNPMFEILFMILNTYIVFVA
jgi:predicted  nucleic acid-binding Zn-ribbon protein